MTEYPSCFGDIMETDVKPIKDCKTCELMKECIEQYDWKVYGWWQDSDEDEDIELCDFTGEECFGNKLFCEECPVLTDRGTSP